MDDIELTSRRGLRSRAYDPLPQGLQQDNGLPSAVCPSYEQDVGPMPNEIRNLYGQSISQSDSINSMAASPEPHTLPPKAYRQSSTQKRAWIHIANATAFVICLGSPLAVLLPILNGASDDGLYTGSTYCVDPSEDSWTLNYSVSNILNISVAYGNLSFGMVKFIDLVWDAFVSRGGQVGLGYVAYRVHNAALLRIMEDKLVSYDLYVTMSLSWTTVWGLRPIVNTFFTNLGFKRRLLLFWVALSVVWVAIWPTITNAMTGYVAKNRTLVRLADGSGYANFSDVASTDTLAFQYEQFNDWNSGRESRTVNWTGPLLTYSGPNVTLWQDLVHGRAFLSSQLIFKPLTIKKVVMENKTAPNAVYNSSLPDGTSHLQDQTPAYVYYYFRNQTYTALYFQDSENVQCVATSTYVCIRETKIPIR
jgi:hypothetical protein